MVGITRSFPAQIPRFGLDRRLEADAAVAQPGYGDAAADTTVIHSKLTYDLYACPVIITAAVAAAALTWIPQADAQPVRKRLILPQEIAAPISPPAVAGIASTITAREDGGTTIWSKGVYDPYARPVTTAPVTADISTPLAPASYLIWAKPKRLPEAIAAPVFTAPVTADVLTPLTLSDMVRRKPNRLMEPFAAPVFQPQPAIWIGQELDAPLVRKKPRLSEPFAAPLFQPLVATWIGQGLDGQPVRKRLQLPEALAAPLLQPVAAAPVTLATTISGLVIRNEIIQVDDIASVVSPTPAVVTIAITAIAPAEQPRGFKRKRYQTPLSSFVLAIPEPGTATPDTLASTHNGLIIRTTLVQDEIVRPFFPIEAAPAAGTATPTTPVWPSEQLRPRPKRKTTPLSSFVFAIPYDIWPPVDTDQPRVKKKRIALQDIVAPPQNVGGVTPAVQVVYPLNQSDLVRPLRKRPAGETVTPWPPVGVGTPTAYTLNQSDLVRPLRWHPAGEIVLTLQPVGVATPSAYTLDQSDLVPRLRGKRPLDAVTTLPVQEPVIPVGTPVPAFLFDWTSNGPGYRINRVAIAVNHSGYAWDAQDPANLTGTVTPPAVEPPVVAPSPGGVWRSGKPLYKRLKLKKKLKREQCDELLEYLRSLPLPAAVVEAIPASAPPTATSLLDCLPKQVVAQVQAAIDDDEEEEDIIALLLEILNA